MFTLRERVKPVAQRLRIRLADPVRHTTLVTAIERELEKKGLVKAKDDRPDVRVRFYAHLDKHLRGSSSQTSSPWNGDLRTSVDLEKMAEGTLIIELYDPKVDQRIWRGTTTQVARASSIDESSIRSAVALVLRAYPPSPEREKHP